MAFSIVSACSNTQQYLNGSSSSQHKVLLANNVNIFLKSFSDHRQGITTAKLKGPKVIYSYRPQVLTNGQMLPVLGYYLYNSLEKEDSKSPISISMDVSIKDVKTLIKNGPVSRFGYYWVQTQARVILKDTYTKEIVGSFPVIVSESELRNSTTGRQPTAEEDRRSLVKLMDLLSEKLSKEVIRKTSDIVYDYLDAQKDIEQAINAELSTKEVAIPQVKEDALNLPKDVIEQLENEEQKLLERKEQQRLIYQEKIVEQKRADEKEEVEAPFEDTSEK